MTAPTVNQIGYTISYTDTTLRTWPTNAQYTVYTSAQLTPVGSVWWVNASIILKSTASITGIFYGLFPSTAATGTSYVGQYSPPFTQVWSPNVYPANWNYNLNSFGVYVVDSKGFMNIGVSSATTGTTTTSHIYFQATRIA